MSRIFIKSSETSCENSSLNVLIIERVQNKRAQFRQFNPITINIPVIMKQLDVKVGNLFTADRFIERKSCYCRKCTYGNKILYVGRCHI